MQIRPGGVNHGGPNYSNYPPLLLLLLLLLLRPLFLLLVALSALENLSARSVRIERNFGRFLVFRGAGAPWKCTWNRSDR